LGCWAKYTCTCEHNFATEKWFEYQYITVTVFHFLRLIIVYFRVKRGRGEIGSRMDEPGPYLPSMHHDISDVQAEDNQKRRVVGPEKPLFLKSSSSAKSTKEKSSSKDKKKEKRKHKKKRKEESSKHRHKHRRSE
jgi:hypothetical protein